MNTLTKRLFWMAISCLPFISSGCKQSETAVKESSISDALYQNLPFEMPKVQQPVFPAYEVNIEKFGACGRTPLDLINEASGTFGYGEEFSDFIDITRIGGIIVKGTTLHKREGNPYPRMAETPSGMLNAVGLQNKGVDYFVEHIYPRIKDIQTNMIVNVSGSAIEDYVKTAEIINELDKIPAIELNISCPNVKQGGMAFGVSAKGASEVVKAVRSAYKKTLIVKLSPNVTDITEIARAAEESGADSVSLINTLLGMAIDAERKRPILSTITGGMSGAAVKPIALRMVWQVAKVVNIPVIGLGGIMDWRDAVEFILAGATAIQIGTANFIDPAVTIKVEDGINNYLERHGCKSVKEIIGALEV